MEFEQEIIEVKLDLSSEHLESIKTALRTLNLCNEKITKLEQSRFYKTFQDDEFTVLLHFPNSFDLQTQGDSIQMSGVIESTLPIFDQDNIDAFALTYRQLIQDNDRISIRNLAQNIYNSPWMFKEATDNFDMIRTNLNSKLDNPITVQLSPDGTITKRCLIDIFLYGGLAHTNSEKEQIFRSWNESGLKGFMWAELYEALLGMMTSLLTIREVNQNIINIFQPLVEQLEEMIKNSQ